MRANYLLQTCYLKLIVKFHHLNLDYVYTLVLIMSRRIPLVYSGPRFYDCLKVSEKTHLFRYFVCYISLITIFIISSSEETE